MTTMMVEDSFGFRFREWSVYKDARLFRAEACFLLVKYPKEELYALADQTKRALSSIILNIAEGANRNIDKDMRVYLNRAHGSLDEVVACLDSALDSNYISAPEHKVALGKASILARQLRGFTKHLS